MIDGTKQKPLVKCGGLVLTVRPRVRLGTFRERNTPDANAYVMLSRCIVAAVHSGWSEAMVTRFLDEATAGTYEDMLLVVVDEFEIEP